MVDMIELRRILAAALAATVCTCALGAAPARSGEPAWERCRKRVGEHKFDSDYDAARTRLKAFLAANPASEHAAEARKELESLESFAEKQIEGIYKRARSFSDGRRFDKALELYTEIITRSPSPEWVKRAREGIERNDKATEPLFAAVKKKCDQLLAEWKYAEAAKTAAKSAEDFLGTKWADFSEKIGSESKEISEFFVRLGLKVEKGKSSPRKTPFKIKDLSGWYVRGKIVRADEQGFMCTVTGAGRTYAWKDLLSDKGGQNPKRFLEIMDLYQPEGRDQLALGILLYRRGFKSQAADRFRVAAKRGDLSDRAERYLDLIGGTLNRVAYDFSSGLQLMDWHASGGRWRIVKGRLVQEGEKGEGDLKLVRHKYKAREVRFFFELTAPSPKGLVSVVLVQDDRNSFGFAFSPEEGYSAFGSIEGNVKTVKDARFRLPRGRKVRVRCGLKGDTFALSVGNRKLPRLKLAGLSRLEGHFHLRSLGAKAGFDNIVIRNIKD